MHDPSPRPTPPQGPPWSGPLWSPPPRRGLSWPVAVIIAAVTIAGAAIAVALITTRSHPGTTNAGTPASATAAPSSSTLNTADSSTCRAWRSTKAALDNAGDPLPADWNWNTHGIDQKIAQSNAIITNAMNLFEPQIASEPAEVATAAHAYVKARRAEVAKFANHTFTEADGVPVNSAFATLNQLCHVPG